MYFFTSEAAVPLREEAREGAEMISQLIFGDTGEILERSGNWARIRNGIDGYEGWTTSYMLTEVAEADLARISSWRYLWEGKLLLEDGSQMALPLGSRVPLLDGAIVPGPFMLGDRSWKLAGPAQALAWKTQDKIPDLALLFLNTPYLWGGRSSFGVDCSGFAQQVYAMGNVSIPRDSSRQQQAGEVISFSDRKPGDLVFFRKENQERVTHVGILYDRTQVIHASGKVRLDFLDENGLIHTESQKRTHWMVSINRYKLKR